MTDLPAAKEAIVQQFVSEWGSTTTITLDGEDFKPPANAPWVRLAIRHNGAGQETLGKKGNRKFARLGSAFVQVFTVAGTGTGQADTLADQAREVFEGKSLAGTTVRFQDVIVREIGPDDKWYQVNVEATFEYDEIK